ncbi:ATP-dependent DNA helicase RecG [Isachenkonia alkalipeptolytica]|uniref:ATP-dependent DNA helicase RecG n=1 Tax=Isachenkonia alkalipeptolytica TaxID=2565777 RepID=A0AA43XMN1_9CLOT|nr:ATP-dependent DNA helicase RecG [Isachenkonia alkalipeptolytica]
MEDLQANIRSLKGVGPKKEQRFLKLNIETLEDLLYHFPRGYEDRREIKKIREVEEGEKTSLELQVHPLKTRRAFGKGPSLLQLVGKDDTGSMVITFFNQPYLSQRITPGTKMRIYGEVKRGPRGLETANPDFILLGDKGENSWQEIFPIYPLTKDVSHKELVKLIRMLLKGIKERAEENFENLPNPLIEENKLCRRRMALEHIHFPQKAKGLKVAKYRLVYEEFFFLMITLNFKKAKVLEQQGTPLQGGKEVQNYLETLPFQATEAQKTVIGEILGDLKGSAPMSRLVQGDVGSGKTVVAMAALVAAAAGNTQGAMMAPTEILAKQHYKTLSHFLEPLGISIGLLTGSLTPKKKKRMQEEIRRGTIDVVVGTHAVIGDKVEFRNLSLVITDEQHRFGVRQRKTLSGKGKNPHVLVMSATPIPRTLAYILYGDLEVSVIDQMPKGRKPVKTQAAEMKGRDRVYEQIKEELNKGRQAYVVCPLIEESETLDLNAAMDLQEQLQGNMLKDYKVGLLHGKMSYIEKEQIMKDFTDGKIQVLVSTTVVEVGVDVPNATVMVIENAERFGLAQLHQLRGRIGRGQHQSYCYLLHQKVKEPTRRRLEIMEQSHDGFEISQKDLEIRGPGELFGLRQHGIYNLKIANFFQHQKILQKVQQDVKKILLEDPGLELEKNRKLRGIIDQKLQRYRD